jgi:carbamoylphosphate synthase large subunit
VRRIAGARAALETVGLPAVLKPADARGGRGLFAIRSFDELEAHLHATLAASPEREAILERYAAGAEVTALLADAHVLTTLDRLADEGDFGLPLAYLHPSRLFGDALAEVERVALAAAHALGLTEGPAEVQLVAGRDGVRVLDVEAGEPREPLAEALRSDSPLAVRFLSGEPSDAVEAPLHVLRMGGWRAGGYVVAFGATNLEALEHADAAARLLEPTAR